MSNHQTPEPIREWMRKVIELEAQADQIEAGQAKLERALADIIPADENEPDTQ